jgi:hypothetical protein
MEIFPAADHTPWELIEKVIAESDYYVVVIGGMYGSVAENGISYTEKEYDLAVKLGKPVLAFVHAEPDAIPAGRSDMGARTRKRLALFRKKVERRLCKNWTNKQDLCAAVVVALTHAIRTNPQTGWIRGGGPDITETLARLADLQQRHDDLLAENRALRDQLGAGLDDSGLSGGEDPVELRIQFLDRDWESIVVSWNAMFLALGRTLLTPATSDEVQEPFTRCLAERYIKAPDFEEKRGEKKRRIDYYHDFNVSMKDVAKVLLQLVALGLVEATTATRRSEDDIDEEGGVDTYEAWVLTKLGQRQFLTATAVRRVALVGEQNEE